MHFKAATEGRRSGEVSPPKSHIDGYTGNEACAKCHVDIYQSYARSAMAHASGPAAEALVAADFAHKRSGVNYRIYSDAGKVWLSFERPGDAVVQGKRELLYYVGQGRRGRTYLFSVDGFLFESPVNWYADRHMWDMAPTYGNARQIPMNLPVATSCLDCHVSGVEPPIGGSENRYPSPPFAYSGVTCERCHGPGAAHVNGGAIVNPAKLTPKLRDQVCMQCHLEGNAAIERAGRRLYEYKAGDDLSKYVRYFVFSGTPRPGGLRATSQFEALAQSVCKQKAGDAMACTSCHDPHQTITPERRVAFYRGRCIACHSNAFATKHHKEQPDCTACHMPASLSTDVAHTEVTDHRILRRPSGEVSQQVPSTPAARLVPFPASEGVGLDLRDLALAWQSVMEGGTSSMRQEGERVLRAALAQSPDDPALLSSLGYLEQKRGENDQAREFYRRALERDASLIDAATNLGVIEAKRGHLAEAVRLWQSAFERAPGRSEIGMNLARAFCATAQYDVARRYTLRVLQFNSDLGPAKKQMVELNATPPRCAQ